MLATLGKQLTTTMLLYTLLPGQSRGHVMKS
jgi:hypothetical protein